jgi:hypothetical protein
MTYMHAVGDYFVLTQRESRKQKAVNGLGGDGYRQETASSP